MLISIHAPRTGSDAKSSCEASFCSAFQSTLPARGATLSDWLLLQSNINFNPRSPHGERHANQRNILQSRYISIHAPRTGSDYQRPSSLRTSGYFNPRSPHGERRAPATSGRPREPFQSTLPARGATGCSPGQMPGLIFQSTLPARGATRQRRRNDGGKQGFQSTLPARGATCATI